MYTSGMNKKSLSIIRGRPVEILQNMRITLLAIRMPVMLNSQFYVARAYLPLNFVDARIR